MWSTSVIFFGEIFISPQLAGELAGFLLGMPTQAVSQFFGSCWQCVRANLAGHHAKAHFGQMHGVDVSHGGFADVKPGVERTCARLSTPPVTPCCNWMSSSGYFSISAATRADIDHFWRGDGANHRRPASWPFRLRRRYSSSRLASRMACACGNSWPMRDRFTRQRCARTAACRLLLPTP